MLRFSQYFAFVIVSIVDGGAPSIDDMQMLMDILMAIF